LVYFNIWKEKNSSLLKILKITALLSVFPESQTPKEEDYFRLAEKLENSPPPDLTKEDLQVVASILRNEDVS